MNRIRVVFVILAVVMFIPLGLLVQNALKSVQEERIERHRTVAERVFDEMERELTRIVQEEESREFAHYRFFYIPEADTRGRYAVARSPLSYGSDKPYILGHFQFDPDRTLHSPLLPREASLGRAFAGWEYTLDIERTVARVERVATIGLQNPSKSPQAPVDLAFAQKPGSTRNVEPVRPEPSGQEGGADAAGGEVVAGRGDAFDALRSLNRGARRQPNVAVRLTSRRPDGTVDVRDLGPLQTAAPFFGVQAMPLAALAQTLVDSLDLDVRLDRYFDVEAALRETVPSLYPVALYPMEGRYVGGDHMLLHRDAILSGQRFVQGVVFDFRALTEWLDQTVLGGSALASHAARDFFMRDAQPARRKNLGAAYVYVHRFEKPFDDLAVRFMLPPLPEMSGTGYLNTIAALLMVSGAVARFALYHMVSVTVRYAERRSNFASAVSHELKTPLTAIRMHGEMLRDGMVPDDAKKKEYFDTITLESERLPRLINNVLEFSRIEQGARNMNLVTGHIGGVLSDAVRTIEGHVAQAGFEIVTEIAEGLPQVKFERDAVVQVVYNLVDNAIKYAGDAEKKVLVLACRRAGETVRMTLRDFGPGVEAKHLRKIFDPFYRGENEMTRTAKGTGIGLALVKGLADHMDAAVSCRNLSDGGFEVAVTFRAATA